MNQHQWDDAELNGFWRQLRIDLLPEPLSKEEAARRMASDEDDAEELDEAEIAAMVAGATGAAREEPPRGNLYQLPLPATRSRRGWLYRLPWIRNMGKLAATLTLSALLLSAGVTSVVLWEGRRDSRTTMGYDDATRILTRTSEPLRTRATSGGRTFRMVSYGVRKLEQIASEDATLDSTAESFLRELREIAEAQGPGSFEHATVTTLKPHGDAATDDELPTAKRLDAVKTLGRETVNGFRCMLEARRRPAPAELAVRLDTWSEKVRSLLDS